MTKPLLVAAFNTKNAHPNVLRAYVKESLDDGNVAIVLTEVWLRHRALRHIAKRFGLTMIAETPLPGGRRRLIVAEHGDTVILCAPEFKVESWEAVVMDFRWYVFDPGPNLPKRLHEPRRLLRVVGTVGKQRLELLGVHGPTGGNGVAVAEFKERVDTILRKTHPDTVSIAAGDFNVRLDDARPWAAANGLRVSGWGPDLALVHGGRTRSRRRGKRGSDHYAMSHKIKPAKRKRTP